MAELTTAIGAINTQFQSMITLITGNALLLIPVGFFVLGGSIGLVKRLLG